MGLLTRLGSIFSRYPGAARPTGDEPRALDFDSAAEGDIVEGSPLDAIDDPVSDEPRVSTRPVNLARPAMRRTKQEWFDELQRNHQELTDLIRKFDAHLDSTRERDERLAHAATEVGRIVPSIEHLARSGADEVDRVCERVVSAIESASERALSVSRESARGLAGLAEQLGRSNDSQAELVTRLAEFRQTMSDVASSSAEATRLLGEMSRRDAERQARQDRQAAKTRLWVIAGVSTAFVLAAGAIAVAIVAIIRAS